MRVLITGTDGFIGKNLRLRLGEIGDFEVIPFTRANQISELHSKVKDADTIVHLAGINRPQTESEFFEGNVDLTEQLVNALEEHDKKVPLFFSSSIHALQDTPYGRSKLEAEKVLFDYRKRTGTPVYISRLANVFGKWCRPDYNSMVATFCHNIARELPIQINNEGAEVQLVYIDDVVRHIVDVLSSKTAPAPNDQGYYHVGPVYTKTVGDIAKLLKGFKESRNTLTINTVGTGFLRKLYSTYVSYLEPSDFNYEVPKHGDERGVFVEMLKTPNAGQFSFFTAHPGVTRGGHYHHTKTEKFLVIKGQALFKFRHMQTNQFHQLTTSGDRPEVVETAPGWSHDITNIGDDELVVMLWANEVFDRDNPDTISSPVGEA